jgi:hypothetical protein
VRAATVVAIALGAFAALATAAEDERPVSSVVAAVKAQITAECDLARDRASISTEASEKEFAASVARLNCDCLPTEIDRAGVDLSGGKEDALVTQPAFLSRMKIALDTCVARLIRTETATRCVSEAKDVPEGADKKLYCQCLSDRLDALEDAALAAAAAAGNRNVQERARARISGQTEPAGTTTALDQIEQTCRQAAR